MGLSGVAARRKLTPAEPLVRRIEEAESIDPPARAVAKKVRDGLPRGTVKDAISGTWLGHPLHPLLTDVVVGSWMSANLLDLLNGGDGGRASERLIAIGIAAAGPTALSGVSDWSDAEPTDPATRRAGAVHALTNVGALSLYAASLAARRRGSRLLGTLLGFGGAAAMGAGAYLGGHLSYGRGVGPDQTVFDPGSDEWQRAVEHSRLDEVETLRVVVDETPVLLISENGRVDAIHDRCSHRGCSLSEGKIEGDEIVCACHGSRYSIEDGSLRRGPAVSPQPRFETRISDGWIELRRDGSA